MQRSLFTTLDTHPTVEINLVQRYEAYLRHVVLAEQLGFDGVWVGEHHGSNIGRIPNPAVLLAAAAARTKTIRLGSAVSVLPLRSPVVLAEDYAMVDAVSGGRLHMGVGVGSKRSEFEHLGVDFERRRELFDEHLEQLLRHWGQTVRAPIYIATLSEDGAYRAGRAGHSILTLVTPAVQDLEEVQQRLRAHEQGLREGGHERSADAVVTFFACTAADEQKALQRAARSLGHFIELSSGVRPEDPVALCEAMCRRGTGLFFARDEMGARVEALGRLGFENLCFFVDFGTMAADTVAETIRSLASPAQHAPVVSMRERLG